jgi:hypothetical protein
MMFKPDVQAHLGMAWYGSVQMKISFFDMFITIRDA